MATVKRWGAVATAALFLGGAWIANAQSTEDTSYARFASLWLPRLSAERAMDAIMAAEQPPDDGFHGLDQATKRSYVAMLARDFARADSAFFAWYYDSTLTREGLAQRQAGAHDAFYFAIFDRSIYANSGLGGPALVASDPDAAHVARASAGATRLAAAQRVAGLDLSAAAVPDGRSPLGLVSDRVDENEGPSFPIMGNLLDESELPASGVAVATMPEFPEPTRVEPQLPEPETPKEFPSGDAWPSIDPWLTDAPPPDPIAFVDDLVDFATYGLCWQRPADAQPTCQAAPTVLPTPVDVNGDLLPDITVALAPALGIGNPPAPGVSWSVVKLAPGDLPLLAYAVLDLPDVAANLATSGRDALAGVDGRASSLPSSATLSVGILVDDPANPGIRAQFATIGAPVGALTYLGGLVLADGPSYTDPLIAALSLSPAPALYTLDFVSSDVERVDPEGNPESGVERAIDAETSGSPLAVAAIVSEETVDGVTSRHLREATLAPHPDALAVTAATFPSGTHVTYEASATIDLAFESTFTPDLAAPTTRDVEVRLFADGVPTSVEVEAGPGRVTYDANAALAAVQFEKASYVADSITAYVRAYGLDVPQEVTATFGPDAVALDASALIGELGVESQTGEHVDVDLKLNAFASVGGGDGSYVAARIEGLQALGAAFPASSLALDSQIASAIPFVAYVAKPGSLVVVEIEDVPTMAHFERAGNAMSFDGSAPIARAAAHVADATATLDVEALGVPSSFDLVLDSAAGTLDWSASAALERVTAHRVAGPESLTVDAHEVPASLDAQWSASAASWDASAVIERFLLATFDGERLVYVETEDVPASGDVAWSETSIDLEPSAPIGFARVAFSDFWGWWERPDECVVVADISGESSTFVRVLALGETHATFEPGAISLIVDHAAGMEAYYAKDAKKARIDVTNVPGSIAVLYEGASFSYLLSEGIDTAIVHYVDAANHAHAIVQDVPEAGELDLDASPSIEFSEPMGSVTFRYSKDGLAPYLPQPETVAVKGDAQGRVAVSGHVTGVQAVSVSQSFKHARIETDHPDPFRLLVDVPAVYADLRVTSIPSEVEVRYGQGYFPDLDAEPGEFGLVAPCGNCGFFVYDATDPIDKVEAFVRRPYQAQGDVNGFTIGGPDYDRTRVTIEPAPRFAYARWQEGALHAETDASIERLAVKNWNPDRHVDALAEDIPTEIDVTWDKSDEGGFVQYVADAVLSRFAVALAYHADRKDAYYLDLHGVPEGVRVDWQGDERVRLLTDGEGFTQIGSLVARYTNDGVMSTMSGHHVLVFDKETESSHVTRLSLDLDGVHSAEYRKTAGGVRVVYHGDSLPSVKVDVGTQSPAGNGANVLLLKGTIAPFPRSLEFEIDDGVVRGVFDDDVGAVLSVAKGHSSKLYGPGAIETPPWYEDGVSVRMDGDAIRARVWMEDAPWEFAVSAMGASWFYLSAPSTGRLIADFERPGLDLQVRFENPPSDLVFNFDREPKFVDVYYSGYPADAGPLQVSVRGDTTLDLEISNLPIVVEFTYDGRQLESGKTTMGDESATFEESSVYVDWWATGIVDKIDFGYAASGASAYDFAATLDDVPDDVHVDFWSVKHDVPEDAVQEFKDEIGVEYAASTDDLDLAVHLGEALWKQGPGSSLDFALEDVGHETRLWKWGKAILIESDPYIRELVLDLALDVAMDKDEGDGWYSEPAYKAKQDILMQGTLSIDATITGEKVHEVFVEAEPPVLIVKEMWADAIAGTINDAYMDGVIDLGLGLKIAQTITYFNFNGHLEDAPVTFATSTFVDEWMQFSKPPLYPWYAKPRILAKGENHFSLEGQWNANAKWHYVCILPLGDQMSSTEEERICHIKLIQGYGDKSLLPP